MAAQADTNSAVLDEKHVSFLTQPWLPPLFALSCLWRYSQQQDLFMASEAEADGLTWHTKDVFSGKYLAWLLAILKRIFFFNSHLMNKKAHQAKKNLEGKTIDSPTAQKT